MAGGSLTTMPAKSRDRRWRACSALRHAFAGDAFELQRLLAAEHVGVVFDDQDFESAVMVCRQKV
jgi:hypothetical protein